MVIKSKTVFFGAQSAQAEIQWAANRASIGDPAIYKMAIILDEYVVLFSDGATWSQFPGF